jgi:prepilin-type N-terminal cleavage/methylation domain-containing protein
MDRQRRGGFTLIELLIVVVIIGILAAIAIPKFSSARDKAFVSAMKADLRNLATLQDIYHNVNFTYSSNDVALEFVESDGVIVVITPGATGQGWSASVTHTGLPGAVCAIYHGNAAQLTPATVVSQTMCN